MFVIRNYLNLYIPGTQYVNNFIEKDEITKCVKAPLEMVMCGNCSLLQLKHTAPQELLYAVVLV